MLQVLLKHFAAKSIYEYLFILLPTTPTRRLSKDLRRARLAFNNIIPTTIQPQSYDSHISGIAGRLILTPVPVAEFVVELTAQLQQNQC